MGSFILGTIGVGESRRMDIFNFFYGYNSVKQKKMLSKMSANQLFLNGCGVRVVPDTD